MSGAGAPDRLTPQRVVSDDGTVHWIVPDGTWVATIPTVAQIFKNELGDEAYTFTGEQMSRVYRLTRGLKAAATAAAGYAFRTSVKVVALLATASWLEAAKKNAWCAAPRDPLRSPATRQSLLLGRACPRERWSI